MSWHLIIYDHSGKKTLSSEKSTLQSISNLQRCTVDGGFYVFFLTHFTLFEKTGGQLQ